MKRIAILFIAALLLVACGDNNDSVDVNANENDVIQENEIETLFEKEIQLIISDTEDLEINLLQVAHGRSELTDNVSLKIEIENKQNKTLEFYIEELKIDGKEIDSTHIWISDDEIKPNELITTFINGYEYDEFTVGEHISGTIIYKDYEGNRSELKFSEYINE